MFNPSQIKLTIWDLDDTFWIGTLSEGAIQPIEKNIALVFALTDAGIINSICSKNDLEPVNRQLELLGVKDHFVFSSVNWEPKGSRIKSIIEQMQLRAANVLFIDDNDLNLREASYHNPGLMTAAPNEIDELYQLAENSSQVDKGHVRLRQYKLLEAKHNDRQSFDSNEDFLFESGIQVAICRDCLPEIVRLHDLVKRSNQLNYTKNRMPLDEFEALLKSSEIDVGYVNVTDRYGDHGIVGFYAVRASQVIHFVFSCRTLGMGIEQYVYAHLDYPQITTAGEVVQPLTNAPKPAWINRAVEIKRAERLSVESRILLKGPCDLNRLFTFIKENDKIDTEFTYVSEQGTSIEQINHTAHIVQSLALTDAQKSVIVSELPFADEKMYSDKMFRGNYSVVLLSVLNDANLGVYRRKETGELVAYAEAYHPLTDTELWPEYLDGQRYTANCVLSQDFLRWFAEHYEFVGRLSAQQIVENMRFIREHLDPGTLMIVLLGSEMRYENNELPAYFDRHLVHKEINDAIRRYALTTKNLKLIDVNRYLKGQQSFHEHFNHYAKPIYNDIAKELVKMLAEHTNVQVPLRSLAFVYYKAGRGFLARVLAPFRLRPRSDREAITGAE